MPRIASCTSAFREVADFEEFAAHIRDLLDQSAGADLVVLPELITFELMTAVPGWRDAVDLEPAVETVQFTDRYRELMAREAAERGQHILAGSHLVRTGDGSLLNVAPLFGPDGALLHEHAKTHLFPLESSLDIGEGDDMEVVELPFGVVGVNICYEAEIPECAASLTEQGVQIVLVPSLTITEAGFWRVRHCAAARAIENQIYTVHSGVASPARGPWPGAWARSAVLGPCDAGWPDNGVLAETVANVDAVAVADVDLQRLADNRKTGAATTFADRRRRAELYRAWPSH
ncbi:nitrilase-related carbon-nitrogen hydrolase [Streptomyces sp. NBC_00690]|uniref:nitrilase-related carbon-nitrogen hydrolase n=1 Tax=Streptomyces sp. NBC_00690 TaxID=2975808 RepID=UPI002E2855CB|nr:nitrilase-related carbon-nitrogen hydrolase [Streptomyces sp. NBC_00690]